MTLTVHVNECSKAADGRTRHHYAKQDGEFRCVTCGAVSDPSQRWEQKERRSSAPAGPPLSRTATS